MAEDVMAVMVNVDDDMHGEVLVIVGETIVKLPPDEASRLGRDLIEAGVEARAGGILRRLGRDWEIPVAKIHVAYGQLVRATHGEIGR